MERQVCTPHTVQITTAQYGRLHAKLSALSEEDTIKLCDFVELSLRRDGQLLHDGWRTLLPTQERKEDETFANLARIADSMHDYTKQWAVSFPVDIGPRTTKLRCDPHHINKAESEIPGCSIRPDARGILMRSTTPASGTTTRTLRSRPIHCPADSATGVLNSDIAYTGQFKNHPLDDTAKTQGQLLGDSSHLLKNDPCRRHMFGFTIECATMRLWYFSRSHVAVTEPFDYHEDPVAFIRFIIFLTFATLPELGYDPTARRVYDEQRKIQYQFLVGDTWYQAVSLIDEARALDIVTRATRVWEVRKLSPEGKMIGDSVVLKDFWLFSGVESERDIQREIFNAIEELDRRLLQKGGCPELEAELETARSQSDEERDSLLPLEGSLLDDAKTYFMTILADEPVRFGGKDDIADGPPRTDERFIYASAAPGQALGATVKSSVRVTEDTAEARVKTQLQPIAQEHPSRCHRRIIFKEYCKTLYNVENYNQFTLGLAHVVKGLNYMRLAGFVHRDISPGNCLLHEATAQVKISDLEYARRYDSRSLHKAPLTGTPSYMAVEYQETQHLFRPYPKPSESQDAMTAKEKRQLLLAQFRGSCSAPLRGSPSWFKFNFLHDLESVVWMYCWFLFETFPEGVDVNDTIWQDVHQYAGQLFNGCLTGSQTRTAFVRGFEEAVPEAFNKGMACLERLYGCLPTQTVSYALLSALRFAFAEMASYYMDVESTTPIDSDLPKIRWDPSHFQRKYHVNLHMIFELLASTMVDVPYKAVEHPFLKKVEPALAAGIKRKAVDDGREGSKRRRSDDAEQPEAGPSGLHWLQVGSKGKGGSATKSRPATSGSGKGKIRRKRGGR